MRALTMALFALLIATASCTRQDFGVQAGQPLGDAAQIERLFAEKELSRKSRDCDLREIHGRIPQDDSEPVPGRCVTFVDDKRAGDEQTAKLYYGADDRLVALRFDYRSDERDFDKGYYKIGRFLFDYWNLLGGKSAKFAHAGARVPILGKEALEAEFSAPGVRGHWVKQVFDGNLRDRVQDEVWIRAR